MGTHEFAYARRIRSLSLSMLVAVALATVSFAAEDLSRQQIPSVDWQPVLTEVASAQLVETGAGVELLSTDGVGAPHRHEGLAGHFEIEGDFQPPFGGGLAIAALDQDAQGGVDLLGIVVDNDSQGHAVVRVVGTRSRSPEGPIKLTPAHRHVLDGRYSLPFDAPDGRLKIARNRLSGTFHLYYGVTKRFGNVVRRGWIELAPVPDWLDDDAVWRPTLVAARSKSAAGPLDRCEIRVRFPAEQDQDDRTTGFAAVRRRHGWSGFDGDAVVVSFDERFRYADRDYKLVFWERTNYVPVWRFDNQTLMSYEFVETWDPKQRGCYEPMSDRLGFASRVSIVEDNAVRKVVEWRYELLNPDYRPPRYGHGQQRAEVVERYTCYPDGRVIRHIAYTPKLDSEHRSWNEIAELIVVAGSRRHPSELLSAPAMTVAGGPSGPIDYFPGRPDRLGGSAGWPTIVAAVHLREHADAIAAFSNHATPVTRSLGNRVRADVSWHATHFRMSHWPVGLEPYQTAHKSVRGQRRQVTHTSLAGFASVGDDSWAEGHEVDERGRSFRQWASLLALAEPNDAEQWAKLTDSWLFPGKLDEAASPGVRPDGHNPYTGEVALRVDDAGADGATIRFRWRPDECSGRTYCPCFRIAGVPRGDLVVQIDDAPLERGVGYAADWQNGNLLLWLNLDDAEAKKISITIAQPPGSR